MTYGKRLHKAARQEFKQFWSSYRCWVAIVPSIAVPVIFQIVRHGIRSMLNIGETLESGLAALVLSMVGTYLIAMRKGAEILDAEHLNRVDQMEKEITKLHEEAHPAIPQIEQQRIRILTDFFASLREGQKRILAYILLRGRVNGYSLQFQEEFETRDLGDTLAPGRDIQLIEWVGDDVCIRSEFEFALEHILRSQGFLPK